MSDDFAPSFHEAGHAVAANTHSLEMIHVSIRRTEESLGRCSIQGGNAVDDHKAAVIMIAGHIAERMALGRENVYPNWYLDDDYDMDTARDFIARAWGDEVERQQEGRATAQLQARSLLTARWDAVQEIAEKLERNTTILGEDVAKVCLSEAARRSARLAAAKPPQPPRPDRVPKKKPRQRPSGDREVRPFTFQVVEKKGMR